MCSDMSDMCERDPVCDIPPIHGKSAKDTRAGRSAAVDMAEPGDTLEKIAADELARILKVTEVLKGIPDNAMRKARQEKMLAQIDDEMEMRRAAVIKRLKTSEKLEVQLARDERRPGKKMRKSHRMECDEHVGEYDDDGGSDAPGGSSETALAWRKACNEEAQEVWETMADAHMVVVAAIGYSKPLAKGWPPGGRGSGKLESNAPRNWTDTANNRWALGKVLTGRDAGKYGLFVGKGQANFNVNARDDARSSVSRTIYTLYAHDMAYDKPTC